MMADPDDEEVGSHAFTITKLAESSLNKENISR